jgi:hypothetical protein
MSNTKFIFLLVTTLVNVYYWRNRGINARRQEVDKARDAESPRTNEVQIEEELSCDSSNESGDKYIYSYFPSNFEAVRMPDIYSVDSNDFDQYRSKYLVRIFKFFSNYNLSAIDDSDENI